MSSHIKHESESIIQLFATPWTVARQALLIMVFNRHLRNCYTFVTEIFPGGSDGKESACNAGDPGLIPGLGRSPGEGNGNPLQYSCLENSMDRGAWQATVHGVAKSQTQLRD